MRELYFASLLLSAGTCIALALQAAALGVQTRNRQYLRLFFFSLLQALYCGLADRYLRDGAFEQTLFWGQGICVLAPCLTYLFAKLCVGVVSSPLWMFRFLRVYLFWTLAFIALWVCDLTLGLGALSAAVGTGSQSWVREPQLTWLGAFPLAVSMGTLTFFMVHSLRSCRERDELLPIVGGAFAFVLCGLLDMATLLRLREGYLVLHLGFLGLVLGSFWFLARRFERALFELRESVTVLEDQRRRLLLSPSLVQKQRLDGLGSLVAAIAHEINNPIQGILNYSSLLRLSFHEEGVARDYLDKVDSEAERVARIARGLLRFGRADEAESQLADLGEIVRATLALTQNAVRQEGITVRVSVGQELPALRCRPYQLQQVLLNLINNARDALAARCPMRTEEKSIQIVVDQEKRDGKTWLTMAIDDNGDGIDPAVATQIFDPFFTTKSSTGGTGLGLSISHGIAEAHGGNLRLVHSNRRGTTFRVDLPCLDKSQEIEQATA